MADDDPIALSAAALRRLRLNLAHTRNLDSFNERLLMKAEQIFTRLETSDGSLTIHNIVSQQTGEGRLDVTWGGMVIQVPIDKAREIGWMFFEAAATAQAEAALVRFLVERTGVPRDRTGAILYDLRQYLKDPTRPATGTPIPDEDPGLPVDPRGTLPPPMPEPDPGHEGGVS